MRLIDQLSQIHTPPDADEGKVRLPTFEKALRRIAREGQSDEGRSVNQMALFGLQARMIARDALGIIDTDDDE